MTMLASLNHYRRLSNLTFRQYCVDITSGYNNKWLYRICISSDINLYLKVVEHYALYSAIMRQNTCRTDCHTNTDRQTDRYLTDRLTFSILAYLDTGIMV